MKYEDIIREINTFVGESLLNRVEELKIEKIYDNPLVGVASASDPLFLKLKDSTIVGGHFLLPAEWLSEARSVISYFLPFSERIREANRVAGLPAKEWLYGRKEGEEFNEALRRHIMKVISKDSNAKALAPVIDSRFIRVEKRSSNWSERHVAYIAGLGTFSLSRSLITSKGCAGRYGSVIVDLVIPPTKRSYTELYEYCNMCGECIDRCPARAIKSAGVVKKGGMDKSICLNYSQTKIRPQYKPRHGCGKCQTAVPCEHKIPEECL